MRKKHRYSSLEFSVVLVDVVGLKQVNDRLGHQAGDALIINAAHCLRRICRESDVLGRYGGDEFLVLCRGSNGAEIHRLAQRIREHCDGVEIRVSDA